MANNQPTVPTKPVRRGGNFAARAAAVQNGIARNAAVAADGKPQTPALRRRPADVKGAANPVAVNKTADEINAAVEAMSAQAAAAENRAKAAENRNKALEDRLAKLEQALAPKDDGTDASADNR